MMQEGEAVGERLGVDVQGLDRPAHRRRRSASARTRPRCCRTCEHGRPLELEALVGSVVELARITGVAMPTIDAIYRAVKLLERTPIAERAASA